MKFPLTEFRELQEFGLTDKEQELEARIALLNFELEHRERQIEAIRRISDALFSHPSVDSMVRVTLNTALEVLRAEAGTVYLYDAKTDSLVFRYVVGPAADILTGKSFSASQGIAGSVFRSATATITGNVSEHDDFNADVDQQTGYHTESMMTVPVKRSDGDPIGVMQVLNADYPPFGPQDLEVLEVLCAQAATGIEHARLVQEARKAEIVHVIGDIAHDIKNMMTPIVSGVWTLKPMLERLFTDLDKIRAHCPDPTTATWAQDIERVVDVVRGEYEWMLSGFITSAEQVAARTKEIADAVKGETSPPFFEEGNLNDTVHDVTRILRSVAEAKRINLHHDLEENLPLAQFDRKQMFNAIYNLVNNAIPFTPPGGTVTVRTRSLPAQNGHDSSLQRILIEVEDTGKGMPEHVRARLFTAETVSTTQNGTGLGTRIVGDVVRRHNGTIQVESEEGKGSRFSIRVPVRHETFETGIL